MALCVCSCAGGVNAARAGVERAARHGLDVHRRRGAHISCHSWKVSLTHFSSLTSSSFTQELNSKTLVLCVCLRVFDCVCLFVFDCVCF